MAMVVLVWLLLAPQHDPQRSSELRVDDIKQRLSHDTPPRPLTRTEAARAAPHHMTCGSWCDKRKAIDEAFADVHRIAHREKRITTTIFTTAVQEEPDDDDR
ncbi:hypothetical protein [Nocardia tenerifensis]|uniref:hypothetical protein n=1 Tax=Nocardia tenerifensis TaxID=228006 RepID=UPI0012F6F783|nr:hypothetical protein [Nocardia tenerifensis]